MSTTDITQEARTLLSETSPQVARTFGDEHPSPQHILYALLTHHPNAAERASVLIGTTYSALMDAVITSRPTKPAPSSTRVLEDAMWFAECRNSRSCGLGDLFYASTLVHMPSLFAPSPYEGTNHTSQLLSEIDRAFNLPD